MPHPSQHERIIRWAHEEVLHGGYDKTMDKIKEHFFWRGMSKKVQRFVKTCLKCAQVKVPNYCLRGLMPTYQLPQFVGEEVQIDFKGPFPPSARYNYKFIVVAQEALSRFLIAECITHANVDNTIKFMEDKVIRRFPNLKRLKHDRGSQFLAERFKMFLNQRNIKSIPTAAYAPHENPVERANRVIGDALTLCMLQYTEEHSNWYRYVKVIVNKINNRMHNATKLRPHIVVYGKEPNDEEFPEPLDDVNHKRLVTLAYENSKKSHAQRSKEYNKKAKSREFEAGQWAMAKYRTLSSSGHGWMSKLAAKYYPVKIIKKLGHNVYEVEDQNKNRFTLDVRSLSMIDAELDTILDNIEALEDT
jgi:hypothetical protein